MTQQQYTPVSWQDETTSQQGTLINAERLNQMQTAHHYADGLEEVDTIPTADPGVAYHKIVYCTADSTIYRWDGEAWTADIDDPTRELLEEHLADHDNPHQVTKSQVGLGNADNTSDMDKPISTATQTALNAKADKSDTYTKSETDTLLGGKADKATTLAGYGITDAYTKTEADTLLGVKANDNAVVKLTGDQTVGGIKNFTNGINVPSTGKTSIWAGDSGTFTLNAAGGGYNRITCKNSNRTIDLTVDATVLRVPTPPDGASSLGAVNIAYLDGYLPMVRTTGNQSIAGIKTFSAVSINTTKWRIKNANEGISTVPSAQVQTQPKDIVDANDAQIYFEQLLTNTDGSRAWRQNLYGTGGHRKIIHMQVEADGTGYLTAPWRTYNTLNADDVVTIATLKQSTDVVHTSGYETIAGVKTFTSSGFTYINIKSDRTSGNIGGIIFQDGNNVGCGQIYGETTGKIVLEPLGDTKAVVINNQRAYSASNTTDVATIGTLDAYTPMVRTTGNQTVGGEKTFQNNLIMYNSTWHTAPRVYQKKNIDSTVAPTADEPIGGGLVIQDKNSRVIWALNAYRDTNGRDVLSIEGAAHDETTGYFHFELSPNSRKISTNFDKPATW